MKTDWMTRLLLGVIAVFLGVIALNGAGFTASATAAPKTPVTVDQKFGNIQISGDQNGFYAFDSATGRIWFYSATNFRGPPEDVGILEEPGRRLGR
jgi:hypothetical protein